MNERELRQVLEQHVLWLEGKDGGRRADLREVNLRGTDFRDTNLRGADFMGADLRNADLGGADLRGADFMGADFMGANLMGANLMGVDLRDVVGNGIEIKHSSEYHYHLSWTKDTLAIGCKQYLIEDWNSFSDEEIDTMAHGALDWWKEYKDEVMELVK